MKIKTDSIRVDSDDVLTRSNHETCFPTNKTSQADERIDLVDISDGLKDILKNGGFTIESILDRGPVELAEELGIDQYVGQIIFKEAQNL